MESYCIMGIEFQICKMKKVLKICCATVRLYITLPTYTLKMVMMVNAMYVLQQFLKRLLNSLCANCIKFNKHKFFAGVYIVIQTLRDVVRHVKAIQTSKHKHSAQIWRGSWIFTLPNRAKVSAFVGGRRAGCPHSVI